MKRGISSSVTRERVKKVIRVYLCIILVLLGYYLLVTNIDIGVNCLFRRITGLKCPGCGNTRAVLCILHGDWAGSFKQNLMLIPEVTFVGWCAVYSTVNFIRTGRGGLNVKPYWAAYVFLAVLLVWWVVRNLI